MKISTLLLAILTLLGTSFGQKETTVFGLQYKPIIPNRLIGDFEQAFNDEQLISNVRQKVGHSYGMIVRHGFTNMFSMEIGLNYNFRKFNLDWAVVDSNYSANSAVRVVSYELPVMGLVFIRLSEELWLNTAIGSSITFFSSDVSVAEPIKANEFFLQEAAYKSKVQGAFLANVGFEYRTRKSGYFYIGSSYHLPYAPIMTFAMSYEYPPGEALSIQNLRGSYLTFDFRYFLPENKNKPK